MRSDYDSIEAPPTASDHPQKHLIRSAGVGYWIIIFCGLVAELGIRGPLGLNSDQAASNILASPTLFRVGILLDWCMSCADVVVSVLFGFFMTKRPVVVALVVVFRLLQQAVIASNLLHLWAGWMWCRDDEAQMAFNLQLFQYGYALALLFFGVSMGLLGHTGFFPKWLNIACALAGLGYLVDSVCWFLVDGYSGNDFLMLPVFVAEFGVAGWLTFAKL